jgi:hypothetical protein
MGFKVGYLGKVTIGATKVLGIGKWEYAAPSAEEHDAGEFGDNWEKILLGIKKGGSISFSGLLDPADSTGQEVIELAAVENTQVTNMRFYIDNTSYYEACRTTGYFSPFNTTGKSTILSYIQLNPPTIGTDKNGVATASFSGRVSGLLVLI